jgi:hypothetical protein
MTDLLNWALNGAFLAALINWAFKKDRPPATTSAQSQANTVNQQGNHNRSIKKKTVNNVSSEALAWVRCSNLERTVEKQQATIDHLEAMNVDKTLLNQELLGMLKDKDAEIRELRDRLGEVDTLPLYDMKLTAN